MSEIEKEHLFLTKFYIHKTFLKNYAKKLTWNKMDAEDLVQTTFLKIYKNIDRIEDFGKSRNILTVSLKNEFITQYRRKKIKPSEVNSIAFDTTNLDQYDLKAGPTYNTSFQGLLSDETLRVFNKLPAKMRLVMGLYITGYQYEEIAAITQMPLGSIRSNIFRAKDKLCTIRLARFASRNYNIQIKREG